MVKVHVMASIKISMLSDTIAITFFILSPTQFITIHMFDSNIANLIVIYAFTSYF